ncbi:MAG: glycogen debranching protein GlgX [Nocardioidaceae bacterium]|nr:glycogen debranching protein GlgX [Nocardioidaceae bacterium]
MTDHPPAALPVRPGRHRPLGASYDGQGTNFAVWAPDAEVVYVCLFDDHGDERRITLAEHSLGVWHGYVPDVAPGQHYGFRTDGRWDPAAGHLFNVDKLLLDPYARAIDKTLTPDPVLSAIAGDGGRNSGDSAPYAPRSVVVGPDVFDWGDDHRLDIAWSDTVVYEAHVHGLTRLHPDVPGPERGSFAGMAHPSVVAYLKDLGVTAIELLPTQHFLSEPYLSAHGLINYWGYNSIGFFAPHAGYSSTGTRGQQIDEFKKMVKNVHAAGIEVILDVVYNHTAESGLTGPAVAFRGYDDGSYYRRDGRGRYADVTGCGNTVQVSEPQVLQLVMDSLRYWVSDMHVDGFRFDLAPALARNGPHIDLRAPFLTAINQDPVLREVKLIAEPWDATQEGYLVGRFPRPWCEWNDKFRDAVRDFWRGRGGGVRDLALRFSGSSDLYADDGRQPSASVNFVAAHDGFTLRDLVTYDAKRNDANREGGRDGTNDNRSCNCGVEGETDNKEILRLRHRQAANMLATLVLSTGVAMITAGDERGRTQGGNNNAFCQDNETSWLSWEENSSWAHLHGLVRQLLRLRSEHPVLRPAQFFNGTPHAVHGRKDITWLLPSGEEVSESDWNDPDAATLGVFLAGDALRPNGGDGEPQRDTSYLIWMHAGAEAVDVTLPADWADHYRTLVRTDCEIDDDDPLKPGSVVTLLDHTFALFEAVSSPPPC